MLVVRASHARQFTLHPTVAGSGLFSIISQLLLAYFPVFSPFFNYFSFISDFSIISQKFPISQLFLLSTICVIHGCRLFSSDLVAVFRNSSHFYSFMPSLLAGFIHGLSGCSDIIHIHRTLPSPPGRWEGRWLFTYSYVLLTELMSKYSVTVYTYVD